MPHKNSTASCAIAKINKVYRCPASAFMPLIKAMIAANSHPDDKTLICGVFFVKVKLIDSIVPTIAPTLMRPEVQRSHFTPKSQHSSHQQS